MLSHGIVKIGFVPLVIASWLAVAAPAMAQGNRSDTALLRSDDTLSLPLYKSGILDLDKVPGQISVGNPGIADILVLRGTQVHVVAKALGSTNVVFWDRDGRIFATVDIEVTHDLDSLKQKLYSLLPNETIGVYSAQEKLVLNGTVSSAIRMQAALDIAESFLPECVDSTTTAADDDGKTIRNVEETTNTEGCEKARLVNLMTVGGSQQVMLEVRVAEISRTFMRNLDSNLSVLDFDGTGTRIGAVAGGANFPNALAQGGLEVPISALGALDGANPVIGPVVDQFDPVTPQIGDTGLLFSKLAGGAYYQLAMELSRSKGLSKILAEPTLTTLTGKRARFVSGGEFPIAVRTIDGIDVTYKEFGVIVDFTPTILDGDRISLDLLVDVSELRIDRELIENSFPIIDKRSAISTVELKNGQTIGIAGLIQDNLVETFSRIPGLGDIPILGHLFRSQEYLSGQTELVMFVTPHLAKPISPDLVRYPTDSFVPPSDFEFYVLGTMSSLKGPKPVSRRKVLDGGFDGVTFGHEM